MKNFDTRVYNVTDFEEWKSSGLLDMTPEFQRRQVWSEKAKSYLIDTVLRGNPIPKIIITQDLRQSRNVRVVVDGQQRLNTILSFMDGDFKISRAHNKKFAGMRFADLPADVQNDYRKYEIGVDVLFDQTYEDILDIFARLNTYSVKLNPQEQLNAKYLGFFKQTAYKLGYTYVGYWLGASVITKSQVARMKEAELASDLLVAILGGIQTNKNIQNYYKNYEDTEEAGEKEIEEAEKIFDNVMTYIGEIYSANQLKSTNFKRIHLFYSLFCSIAQGFKVMKGLEKIPQFKPTKSNAGRIRVCLDDISKRYDEEDESKDFKGFLDASRRATTDTSRRISRSKFLCEKINKAIKD